MQSLRRLLPVLAVVLMVFAGTMLVPLLFALIGHDDGLLDHAQAMAITFFCGFALFLATRSRRSELQPRDGFLLVTLVWSVLPAFGTLPLLLHLPGLSFTDAYFEAVSGLTTTGATVLTGLEKLPTTVSVALARALAENNINTDDIGSHSTLTSLYGILAMARIHSQNPRTYAEIMSTGGDGRKIVRSFAENLIKLIDMSENGRIQGLCDFIEQNKQYLSEDFLKSSMKQSLAVDEVLGKMAKS